MKVRIKKLVPEAIVPEYAHVTDAGCDLVATSKWIDNYGNICYGTGLAFEIPDGYVGMIFPRSSVSKYDLSLCNSVGIIDSSYRGEVIFKFTPTLAVGDVDNDTEDDEGGSLIVIPGENPYSNPKSANWDHCRYEIGDKIGQIIIMPYPHIEYEEVDELSDTERGEGGFGSTGN